MPNYILKINKTDNKIIDITELQTLPEFSLYYYTNRYIGTSPPNINDIWVDTRTYINLRKLEYENTSDKLYIDWRASVDADLDIQAIQDAKKQAWIDSRNAIKTKYPVA